jgi:diguanylate cyclase (GGDEF)-like protein
VETEGDDAVVAATRAIPDTAWGLVTQTERGEAFGGADRLVWAQVIGFVVGGVALAIGTWLLTRSVLARIERLTAGAEALSEGNLEARIGDRGADELGVLARAFDRMADTIAEDVERRTQIESRLDHQARHDPLTGLPNRAELERSLRAVVARRRTEHGSHAALLFCDLDDFKAVNDELGHAIGDELLCTIAARFRGVIGPGDVLARFGGDEFVVLCPNLASPEAAERLAARLRGALGNPIVLAGREITASVSVGIAPFDPSTSAAQVLKDADAAMYRAKERRRRQRSAATPERSARHEEIATWHEAIERDEFTLLFQPIRRLRDRRVVAVEALVRRRQGDHLRLPGEFLGRLEALHLLPTLDRWVLGRATAQLAAWRNAGLPDDVKIVVNASPATFDDDRAVARAIDTLAGVGLQPENLVIDLHEQAIGQAGQHHALARLAATGVHIAIDDFGKGAIGIGRLHTVVAKQIKLDRSIVADVDRSDRACATARSLLGLAHDLGLSVVAEGVERPTQSDALIELGCELAQGFALGLPVWPEDLTVELCSVRSGLGESGAP